MRQAGSVRGFLVGVFVGTLIGSVGMAAASFGYSGWTRFSRDFRGGYIAGFLDMANLARNLQPGGWVDKRYPYLPQVQLPEWEGVVEKLYADPANQKYRISSILQAAATKLVERYGAPADPMDRALIRSQQQLANLSRRLTAKAAEDAKAAATATDKGAAPAKDAVAPGKDAAAVKPAPPAAAKVAAAPRPRKWCRCDGSDPRAEREARKKAKAAAEAALDEEIGSPATAPAAPAAK